MSTLMLFKLCYQRAEPGFQLEKSQETRSLWGMSVSQPLWLWILSLFPLPGQ